MSRRRRPLPAEAPNEGVRQLRVICQRQTFGQVARRALCDEATIRRYARGIRHPHPEMRDRLQERLGIPAGAWDEPCGAGDSYAGGEREPPTAPRPR